MVENRNWTYRLYEKVASGEKIESRKEMQKLLRHVEDQLYDGVVVMDRLGRGENKDWALIKDMFLNSETVIITPNKVSDLEIDNDGESFDFMFIFARMEYKTINRRMKQELRKGCGQMVSLHYHTIMTRTQDQMMDETKRPIYRAIIEKYLKEPTLVILPFGLRRTRYPLRIT
ncbi:hypothetical protein AMS62_21275 [Bacillus sp. FJAT-18019]|nr:hypothetical protein AMS62_21275 [Bacillus sp. FJAT-18019]